MIKAPTLFTLFIFFLFLAPTTYARVTPEDILNSQRQAYQSKSTNYSSENKQKLETLSKKIADLNKEKTDLLLQVMERQGLILDEYLKRKGIVESGGQDGINRNLKDPVENARYQITFAHEAIAYQKAKIYVYSLTSESNITQDANRLVGQLKADLEATRQKVINSQNTLKKLIAN